MEVLQQGADTLPILLAAIMVLAMHVGFAFLELGTVRRKNQVNALIKFKWIFQSQRWSISWWATASPRAPVFSLAPRNWWHKIAIK
jgi:ammonia channel protein AmtB